MSISLNNHEVRIKNLENKINSSGGRITKVWSGNMSWSQDFSVGNISMYDFIILQSTCGLWVEYIPIPVTGGSMRFSFGDPSGRTIHDINTSNGNITYTKQFSGAWHEDNKLTGCWGLKIYYIFRYNIYSKIIRSIISSLDKIFTLLKLGFKGVN